MTVSYESWHSKLYRLWYRMKHGYTPSEGHQTFLCPYMRAVLFWWWMRWFFISGKVKKIYVPVVSWLFLIVEIPRWAGIFSYPLKAGILFFYMVVGIVCAVILFGSLVEHLNEQGKLDPLKRPAQVVAGRALVKTTSFFTLLWSYVHDRVCPSIEFSK